MYCPRSTCVSVWSIKSRVENPVECCRLPQLFIPFFSVSFSLYYVVVDSIFNTTFQGDIVDEDYDTDEGVATVDNDYVYFIALSIVGLLGTACALVM